MNSHPFFGDLDESLAFPHHEFLLCNKRMLILIIGEHPLLQEGQFRKKVSMFMGNI